MEFNATSPSLVDTGLLEGTIYTYKVKAFRGGNTNDASGWSGAKMATTFPSAVAGVTAVAQEIDKILLSWTNVSAKADHFIVHDHPTSGGADTDSAPAPTVSGPQSVQESVAPGSAHQYSLFATVSGFQNVDPLSTPAPAPAVVRSAASPVVSIKPLVFKAALTTNQPGFEGFTIVQRIKTTSLSNSGGNVKITVQGSTAGNLVIDKVSISQAATGAAADPWDSAPDLVQVAASVTLAANIPQVLGPVAYNLDRTKDLLIAFDIKPAAGSGRVRKASLPGVGVEAYTMAADPPEALLQDRTDGGYNTEPETLYLIEKIEVT